MRQASVKEKGRDAHANRGREAISARVLDLVFPSRCAGCREWSEAIFCLVCQRHLKIVAPPICYCCGVSFDALAQVLPDSLCADCRDNRYHRMPILDKRRAPFIYLGPVRKAIHAFKYRGKTSLATPLSALLLEYSRDHANGIFLKDIQLIVPVPLHPVRKWRRGYNQSTLLAQELSKSTGIACAEVLRRTRHTVPQVELHADERTQNIKGAFDMSNSVWPEYSGMQNVLLIDDVATTGATLEECARVLKKRGVKTVSALTLAR